MAIDAKTNANTPLDTRLTRRGFVTLCGLGLASLGLAACGAPAGATATNDKGYTLVEAGTLMGVSDMAYPPLESIPDGGGSPEGFEIDMMDAIAKKLGLTMKWLPATKFDTIIPLIKQGGKADVGVSAFTITDERSQEIDFTESYLDSNQGLVTPKAAGATSKETLNVAGTQIAVQSGTTGESWVRENLPQATCVPLDDAIQALTGVQTGLYAAAVADLPVMSYLCNQSYTSLQVSIEIPTGEQYGIVVSKDNAKLTQDINKALAELRSDGTMDSLQQKWFGTTL
jgi:polar amino acid transport system substrate-binding protein